MSDERNDPVTRHVLISGHVIGVGMRRTVERVARRLSMGGWVRNRADGRVEMMFTAPRDVADRFPDDLRREPAGTGIDAIDMRDVRPRDFRRFRVLRTFGRRDTAPPPNPTDERHAPSGVPVVNVDKSMLGACQRAYDNLPTPLRRHVDLQTPLRNWRFGQFRAGAEAQGMHLRHLGENAPPLLFADDGQRRFGLDSTRPSWLPTLSIDIFNDKRLTKTVLQAHDLPVPRGAVVETYDEGLRTFRDIGRAVAVKPVFGSDSRGVTTAIVNEDEFSAAWAFAQSTRPGAAVIVEENITGADLRILLAGQDLIVAYLRIHANIVGDGTKTVMQLVDEKNALRRKLPGVAAKYLIQKDAFERTVLREQDLNFESVPRDGQLVLLGLRPNFTDGADMVPVTELLHPEIAEMCRNVVGVLGTKGWWGLDILSEDFTAPLSQARTVLCEANSRPVGGVFRYVTHGTHTYFIEEALARTSTLAPETPAQSGDTWNVLTSLAPGALPEQDCGTVEPTPSGSVVGFGADRVQALNYHRLLRGEFGPALECVVSDARDIRRGVICDVPDPQLDQAVPPVGDPLRDRVVENLGADWQQLTNMVMRHAGGDLLSLSDNGSFAVSILRLRRRLAFYDLLSTADIPHVPLIEIRSNQDAETLPDWARSGGELLIKSPRTRLRVLRAANWNAMEAHLQSAPATDGATQILLAPSLRRDLEAVVVGDSVLLWALRMSGGTTVIPMASDAMDRLARDAVAAIPGLVTATVRFALSAKDAAPAAWAISDIVSTVTVQDYPDHADMLVRAQIDYLLGSGIRINIGNDAAKS